VHSFNLILGQISTRRLKRDSKKCIPSDDQRIYHQFDIIIDIAIIDQMIADQRNILLDVLETVTLDVEANLAKGRALLETTRHGNVQNVSYTATAA
jgi:hypothetical protein